MTKVLASGTAIAAGVALGALAFASRYVAPYRPVLERIDLPLPAGHEALAGLRIGFVTDTHLGPFVSKADLERALRLITVEAPDLLLFGGDYVSESPRHIEPAALLLGGAAKSAALGGYAVLGNHDLANDTERVIRALEANGITVLRNRAIPIDIGAGRGIRTGTGTLWLAGLDDAVLGRADFDATFRDVPPGAAVLALWHEPDWAEATAARGAFAQLSGHSHGGQVRLPIVGPLAAPAGGRRFVAGMNATGGMPVYTSRGVGIYRPPARFACPPEVTLVTLVAPATGPA